MPGELKFKAVIFDMDGTLINSTQIDFKAWQILFQKHHLTLTLEDYIPLLGIKSDQVIKTILKLEGNDLQQALQDRLNSIAEIVKTEGVETIPYASEFLSVIKNKGFKMALATSSRRKKMELMTEKAGLGSFFDVIITGDEIKNGKPAPDIFTETAAKLGCRPNECLVFEDATNGVKAAKAAGMTCIAITTTHKAEMLQEADLVIDSFRDKTLKNFLTVKQL